MNKTEKSLTGLGIAFTLFFIFWLFCLNHVSVNSVCVFYNSNNGNIWTQTNAGWYLTHPLVRAVDVPTVPIKVEILSSANTINQKIVRIRPDHIKELVKIQGFGIDMASHSTLVGYAFSGREYSFLEIVEDGTKK